MPKFTIIQTLLSGKVQELCADEKYEDVTKMVGEKLEMTEADIIDLATATVGQFKNILYCRIRNIVQSNPIKNFDFPKQSPSKGFST